MVFSTRNSARDARIVLAYRITRRRRSGVRFFGALMEMVSSSYMMIFFRFMVFSVGFDYHYTNVPKHGLKHHRFIPSSRNLDVQRFTDRRIVFDLVCNMAFHFNPDSVVRFHGSFSFSAAFTRTGSNQSSLRKARPLPCKTVCQWPIRQWTLGLACVPPRLSPRSRRMR